VSRVNRSPVCFTEAATPAGSTPLPMGFTYNASREHVTERYLCDTFSPGQAILFDLDLLRPNVSVLELLDAARSREEALSAFAHLVDTPGLPRDLHCCPIPTVALDVDSFGWTSSRIRWSMLFDYVFVWHLSFAPRYQAAGHPKVFVLPHAVDAELFGREMTESNRPLDLGWVGGMGYYQYIQRRRIIKGLAARFKMNDHSKQYTKQETAEIYRASKIVVNVSRAEFPQEANMRCYEAMAGGALLITGTPTELTEWGFREGEHFVGWRNEQEIPGLVEYYLRHENERLEIARAGQRLTLRDFTFQKCRDQILRVLQEHRNQFFAPARSWPAEEVSLAYLECYYRHQLLDAALQEMSLLRKASWRAYAKGLPMALKTLRHGIVLGFL